jgi:Zn-dependent protease
VQAPDLSQVLQSLWGMAYSQPVHHHKGKIWHFSKEEKRHLLLATGAFTLALGFMTAGGMGGMLAIGTIPWITTVLIMMPIMLVAVGPAFLLHEIGHKLVAKHYGCWAEFRADPQGLKFGVMIAFILGFLFMAPGAVMVAGRVNRKQNGHIAAAGPLVNLGLFLIGIPLGAILLAIVGVTDIGIISKQGLSISAMALIAVRYWLMANLILGLFNMLPFGPLDGLKVKEWSEGAFYALIVIFSIPVLLWIFLGKIDVMDWVINISNLIS